MELSQCYVPDDDGGEWVTSKSKTYSRHHLQKKLKSRMRKTLHDPHSKLTVILPVINELTCKDITKDLLEPALKTLQLKEQTVVQIKADEPVHINDVQLQPSLQLKLPRKREIYTVASG